MSAYQGFWNIQVQAYSQGSLDGIPISTYVIGKADGDVRQTLASYVSQSQVMRGRPALNPQITALDLKQGTATIKDCIDTVGFYPVDRFTGKPVALTSKVHRHPWTFTAVFDNVQWRINDGSVDRSKTC